MIASIRYRTLAAGWAVHRGRGHTQVGYGYRISELLRLTRHLLLRHLHRSLLVVTVRRICRLRSGALLIVGWLLGGIRHLVLWLLVYRWWRLVGHYSSMIHRVLLKDGGRRPWIRDRRGRPIAAQ